MKNASSKVTFLLYYNNGSGNEKITVLTKNISLPDFRFRPTYITMDDVTISTDLCNFNIDKNELTFINKIDYKQSELHEYKIKINKLLEKGFKLEIERGES